MSGKRLTEGFREIIELKWSEFIRREQALDANNFDAILTALIRACFKGNLRAITVGLDRLDGKIATEIEVEYPKFYTLYPRATRTADDDSIIDIGVERSGSEVEAPITPEYTGAPADMEEQEAMEEELPTGSLRAVLERMIDSPKDIVDQILDAAKGLDKGITVGGDPTVKSVIVAGLMKLVHDNKLGAVLEVFDQLDGKVAESYKVLGADVYIKNFALIAPAGAVKNDDGIYQIAAENTTNSWVARLEEKNKKGR